MTEFVGFVIGCVIVAAFTYAGYLAGRDAGARKADETVANLRRRCAVLSSQRDRAVESNARMARTLGFTRTTDPEAPEWMR